MCVSIYIQRSKVLTNCHKEKECLELMCAVALLIVSEYHMGSFISILMKIKQQSRRLIYFYNLTFQWRLCLRYSW